MSRFISAAAVLGLLLGLTATAGAADEKKKKKKKNQDSDIAAVFNKLDTNGDKKLSKDEFSKFTGFGDKVKEGKEPKGYASARDDWFKKLDTNNDGFLSPMEFSKIKEVMAANPAKKKKDK